MLGKKIYPPLPGLSDLATGLLLDSAKRKIETNIVTLDKTKIFHYFLHSIPFNTRVTISDNERIRMN